MHEENVYPCTHKIQHETKDHVEVQCLSHGLKRMRSGLEGNVSSSCVGNPRFFSSSFFYFSWKVLNTLSDQQECGTLRWTSLLVNTWRTHHSITPIRTQTDPARVLFFLWARDESWAALHLVFSFIKHLYLCVPDGGTSGWWSLELMHFHRVTLFGSWRLA